MNHSYVLLIICKYVSLLKGKNTFQNINKTFYEQNNIFTIKNLLDNLNNQNTMLIDVSLNDIYVNITDDSITMSNDDFNSLINKCKIILRVGESRVNLYVDRRLKNLNYTSYIIKLCKTRPNWFKIFLYVDYKPL